jgi:cell division GTPase FtsZ
MASTVKNSKMTRTHAKNLGLSKKKSKSNDSLANVANETELSVNKENKKLNEDINYTRERKASSEENSMPQDSDFDFVSHFDENAEVRSDELLPDNEAPTALSCAFIGLGGGGGKLANAFLELGFNKTILVNTTAKDQPDGLMELEDHFLLIPGADGVGKNVELGTSVLSENSTLVEDVLRTKVGSVDWLFVCAGGGGGTGSSVAALNESFERHLKSVQGCGKVVYLVTNPTAQEMLNPTIKKNSAHLLDSVSKYPHIVLDNEKQLKLLRGKVGILGMYPAANKAFAKMFSLILKLSSESSSIQTFDSKDLESCLSAPGRIFLGTSIMRDPEQRGLGSAIYQNCLGGSPCPAISQKGSAGALLLIAPSAVLDTPEVSNHLESAISYVGGRADTLFSGVYVNEGAPGLIAIMMMCGL